MAYIVGIYCTGPHNRYDGSRTTSKAEVKLFREKGKAIEYIINVISNDIDEVNRCDEHLCCKLTDKGKNQLLERLDTDGVCKYFDLMYTLEFQDILS